MPYFLRNGFVSADSDSPDTTLVRPSNWNANLQYGTVSAPTGSPAMVREILTQDRTYFVRTDGSDSNTGLADTSAGAFLTIAHALDIVFNDIDFSGYNVTITIGNGVTWTEAILIDQPWVGAGTITFDGGNKTFQPGAGITWFTVNSSCSLPGPFIIQNATIVTSAGGSHIIHGGVGKVEVRAGVVFGSCPGGVHAWAALPGAYIEMFYDYTITGTGCLDHIRTSNTGTLIYNAPSSVTIIGTPAWSGFFANASMGGAIISNGVTSYSTGATGARYSVALNGIINTNGAGANYFPGTVAGSSATGGLYV